VPEVDALVILGELESQVRAAMRFDEDVYELLLRTLRTWLQLKPKKRGKRARSSIERPAARSKYPFLKGNENAVQEHLIRTDLGH